MQKAPDWKGSGLKPLTQEKESSEVSVVHVFGKNLEERVITETTGVDVEASSLFAPDPNKETQQVNTKDDSTDSNNIETLKKRKFDAITGEEDEETVFQGDYKLFTWDLKSSNWVEKGRGQLKLNDSNELRKKKSRLIMRICGTLRIILNVSISKTYFKVIAASKTNIRFTDSQTLWAASGNNAQQLKDLLEERIEASIDTNDEIKKKPKNIESDLESLPTTLEPEDNDTIEPDSTKDREKSEDEKQDSEEKEQDNGEQAGGDTDTHDQKENTSDSSSNESDSNSVSSDQEEQNDHTSVASSGEENSGISPKSSDD